MLDGKRISIFCGFQLPHRSRLSSSQILELAHILLEHGAAPNMPDQHGKLPLHHAARMGQFPSVRLLLANGANPQIPLTKRGWNVLHVCSFHGFENTIEVVIQMKPDMVHSKTEQWETPLHLAARGGHVQTRRDDMGPR